MEASMSPEWFSIFSHMDILFVLGTALFLGTIGGRVAQKLRIPQVVGYILVGLALGLSGVHFYDPVTLNAIQPLSYFALGLIGFMIGAELKLEVLRQFGRQFLIILLFEGLTAFIIVTLLVGLAGSLLFDDPRLVWSFALLLGAIASATAPAATTDVIWEYKTRGPLTRTILGLVALDDALALLLFAFASSIAGKLMGNGEGDMGMTLLRPFIEVGGSLLLGGGLGLLISIVLRHYMSEDRILSFTVGGILLGLGLAQMFEIDMLMVAMAVGAVLVNHSPQKSKQIFRLLERFTPPVYVLFFVFVGANLKLNNITGPVFILCAVYLIGRTLGKMTGSYLGATVAGAQKTVARYLPFCLFSQAGVAIGLSILASHRFEGDVGGAIIAVITATTFVVQIIGPTATKIALTKAKEVGLNVTEEDLIRTCTVKDIFEVPAPAMTEGTPVSVVLGTFSQRSNSYYPVVDLKNELCGVIGFDSIKNTFMTTEINDFLLAHDIMEPVLRIVPSNTLISDAKEMFLRDQLDYLAVQDVGENVLGIVEARDIDQLIRRRLLQLHSRADALD